MNKVIDNKIMKKFKFKLCDALKNICSDKDYAELIYNAEQISEEIYRISWILENKYGENFYDKRMVEKFISSGDWIMIKEEE